MPKVAAAGITNEPILFPCLKLLMDSDYAQGQAVGMTGEDGGALDPAQAPASSLLNPLVPRSLPPHYPAYSGSVIPGLCPTLSLAPAFYGTILP